MRPARQLLSSIRRARLSFGASTVLKSSWHGRLARVFSKNHGRAAHATHFSILLLLFLLSFILTGCAHPNEENIRLRKINQELLARISKLTVEHDADQRMIEGLRNRSPAIAS